MITLTWINAEWKSSMEIVKNGNYQQITRMGIITCVERKSTWGMKNIKMEIVKQQSLNGIDGFKMKIKYSMWKMCLVVCNWGSVGV